MADVTDYTNDWDEDFAEDDPPQQLGRDYDEWEAYTCPIDTDLEGIPQTAHQPFIDAVKGYTGKRKLADEDETLKKIREKADLEAERERNTPFVIAAESPKVEKIAGKPRTLKYLNIELDPESKTQYKVDVVWDNGETAHLLLDSRETEAGLAQATDHVLSLASSRNLMSYRDFI